MKKINYSKLMSHNPTVYCEFTNLQGKRVQLCEHPIRGDESPVLIVFPDEQLAFVSDFYDTDDLCNSDYTDYQPLLTDDGECICAYEVM